MTEKRLIDIESQMAFLEKEVTELNSVVCEQQKQIDRMEKLNSFLLDQLKSLTEQGAETRTLLDDKPPHY